MEPGSLKAWGWKVAEKHPFWYSICASLVLSVPVALVGIALNKPVWQTTAISLFALIGFGATMLINFRKAGFWGPEQRKGDREQ